MVVPSWNQVFSRGQVAHRGYLTWWPRTCTMVAFLFAQSSGGGYPSVRAGILRELAQLRHVPPCFFQLRHDVAGTSAGIKGSDVPALLRAPE